GQPDINSWGCDNPTENASSQCTTNDVAYDNGTDQLFVADGGNVRVLEYDMSGTITDGMAATHVIGQTNFTGFQCHLNQAGMCGVVDVEVDSVSHRLFVE